MNLESIIPNEISQTKETNTAWNQLCVKYIFFKKIKLIEVESRKMVASGWGAGEIWRLSGGRSHVLTRSESLKKILSPVLLEED